MMNPPQTLADLISYLENNPRVRCRHPQGAEEERTFLGTSHHALCWRDLEGRPRTTPIVCGGGPIEFAFNPAGFSVRLGQAPAIEFDYLP